MATVTNAVTLEAIADGGIVKCKFEYTTDDGAIHTRRAWIVPGADVTAERTARAVSLLDELAAQEADQLLGGF